MRTVYLGVFVVLKIVVLCFRMGSIMLICVFYLRVSGLFLFATPMSLFVSLYLVPSGRISTRFKPWRIGRFLPLPFPFRKHLRGVQTLAEQTFGCHGASFQSASSGRHKFQTVNTL